MAKQTLTTPKGRAVFPSLHAPDFKYNKEYGNYKIGVAFTPDTEGLEAFLTKLDELHDESLATAMRAHPKDKSKIKKGNAPYTRDEETGEVTISFSTAAGGKNKDTGEVWSRRMAVFDAKGKPVKAGLKVGGGSIVRVSFSHDSSYSEKDKEAFVKRFLEAVQVIELKTWEGKDAKSYGFGAEEDGYDGAAFDGGETDNEATETPEADASSEPVDDKGGDF